ARQPGHRGRRPGDRHRLPARGRGPARPAPCAVQLLWFWRQQREPGVRQGGRMNTIATGWPTTWIHGIGVIAPGIDHWPQAQAVLRGEAPWANTPSVLPSADRLPAAERRRASRVVRIALALGL